MSDWLIFVGLAIYFAIALPFALRDQDRYLNERHSDGSDCLCGEINARHCPVHNDGKVCDE